MTVKSPLLIELPMPITTERLIIRPSENGEGGIISEAVLESFDQLEPWIPWARQKPTAEDSEIALRQANARWISREDLRLGIYDKKTGQYLGGTGFHRMNWQIPRLEIGYWIRNSAVGRGYVSEAANALTQYGFKELKAKRIEIRCDSRNKKSWAVAERLGYKLDACLKNSESGFTGDGPVDMNVYARFDLQGLPELKVSWN
jgi:RimJ/RimL family protein N-acetyltransferase